MKQRMIDLESPKIFKSNAMQSNFVTSFATLLTKNMQNILDCITKFETYFQLFSQTIRHSVRFIATRVGEVLTDYVYNILEQFNFLSLSDLY